MLTYDELEEVLEAVEARRAMRIERASTRAQARPGNELKAIAASGGGLTIESFTWGFDAPWSRKLVFNTRIESALSGTRMWDVPIREGRCVLPVATFFEPHRNEMGANPHAGRAVKRQYEFSAAGDEPTLIASVCQDGRLSVVTTAPNASVSPIHNRMPLVLRFEEVGTWLDGDYASLADRSSLELSARPEDDDPQFSLF